MNVAIPPEFEALARKMVDCGTFASVDEAVAAALHDQASRIADLRSEIEKGIASLDRGAGLDAETAMRDLIVETRARYGGDPRRHFAGGARRSPRHRRLDRS